VIERLTSNLQLKVHMKAYDRALPILTKQVPIGGVEPEFVPFEIENFERMLTKLAYDISEMSFSSYLIGRELGVPIKAIPVFPHRRFRHSYIFTHTNGLLNEPRDLIGKRIGIPIYQPTAIVWIRGILQDEYDVRPYQMKFYFDREREPLPISLPSNVSLQSTGGIKKEKLFLEGKLDALFDSNIPNIFAEGNPEIRRLFENYRDVELAYYKKTRIFPIMHTIVIREELLKEHPWLAEAVWRACIQSKKQSYERMKDPRLSNLVWPHVYWNEEKKIFGNDFWPYNLEDNRRVLETFIGYSKEQGLIKKEPKLEDLFAPSTIDLREEKEQYVSVS
jgi:4,5-dihydroxyphthalate decarboxylase